jgi:hypothetical protein
MNKITAANQAERLEYPTCCIMARTLTILVDAGQRLTILVDAVHGQGIACILTGRQLDTLNVNPG